MVLHCIRFQYAHVAPMVEHRPRKSVVVGSNPTVGFENYICSCRITVMRQD